jgi:hypothetical protein
MTKPEVRMSRNARLYGLTLEEYQEMLEAARGVCPICLKTRKLYIDHDHQTGRVRGLLCNRCNLGVGLLEDSAENLARGTAYLLEKGS